MQLLFNNLGLKLAALGSACLLAVYVYLDVNYQVNQTFTWGVRPRAIAEGLALASAQPELDQVRVRVRGPVRSINALSQRSIEVAINCREVLEPGTIQLRPQVPDLGDVEVVDVQPSLYELTFEAVASRTLSLRIDRRGQLANGFVLTDSSAAVEQVEIHGPASLVEMVSLAQIEPDLNGVDSSLSRSFPVRIYGDDGALIDSRLLSVVPSRVRYNAEVRPENTVRLIRLVPELTGSLAEDLMLMRTEVSPQYVPVLRGLLPAQAELVARTKPVSLAGATTSFVRKVQIVYPFKVTSELGLPAECEVRVELASFDESSAVRVPIELLEQSAEFDYLVSPPQVVIRSEELASLAASDKSRLRASILVSGLGVGEHRISPQLSLPQVVDRIRVDPQAVVLTIIAKEGE